MNLVLESVLNSILCLRNFLKELIFSDKIIHFLQNHQLALMSVTESTRTTLLTGKAMFSV